MSVPTSEFIVGHLTVRKDIVSKLPHIQATIRSSLQESAELGAVSVVTDLWSDNVVSRSYLDVTLFWVEESGPMQHSQQGPTAHVYTETIMQSPVNDYLFKTNLKSHQLSCDNLHNALDSLLWCKELAISHSSYYKYLCNYR